MAANSTPSRVARRGFTLIELLVDCHSDRLAAASGAAGPRSGPPQPVQKQHQADRPGSAQLPRYFQQIASGVLSPVSPTTLTA